MAKNKKITYAATVAKTAVNKKANIIVAVVAGITALILIAIVVMCFVRVDPLDGLAAPTNAQKGERYELYDAGGRTPIVSNDIIQSKIGVALGEMDFSVMSAVLQWNWDYSYNFVRNANGDKITMTSQEITDKFPSSAEYMVEYVYQNATVGGELNKSTAHSLEVDGETIYFDRVRVIIGDTGDNVGVIYLYPYIYERATNTVAGDGVPYNTYRITPIKVRANTTETYAALAKIIEYSKTL